MTSSRGFIDPPRGRPSRVRPVRFLRCSPTSSRRRPTEKEERSPCDTLSIARARRYDQVRCHQPVARRRWFDTVEADNQLW